MSTLKQILKVFILLCLITKPQILLQVRVLLHILLQRSNVNVSSVLIQLSVSVYCNCHLNSLHVPEITDLLLLLSLLLN